jgi:type II secretory pathway component PulF
MALFSYRAVCSKGIVSKGTWVGASVSDLYAHLKKQDLTLLRHRCYGDKNWWRHRFLFQKHNLVPMFCAQMRELLGAKIHLIDAINIAMESQESPYFRMVLQEIINSMAQGTPPGKAFQAYPAVFDVFFVTSLHMAEKTGDLAQAFKNLEIFYAQKQGRQRALKKALAYPALLLAVLVVIFYGLGVLILPNMEQFFHTLGLDNHSFAFRSLKACVDFFQTYGSLAIYTLGSGILWMFAHIVFSKNAWEKLANIKRYVPILGAIRTAFELADFLNYLALLLKQKENLLSALTLASQSIQCVALKRHMANVCTHVQLGKTLKMACEETCLFSPATLKFIDIGEHTGQLESMLTIASENLSRQTLSKVNTLIGWCGPVLISFMGALIVWIVLATVVPIYDILAVLHF